MSYKEDDFKFSVEQFADVEILRYQVPGYETLSLTEKTLAYYLYEAALSGREIIYDQNYKHNLKIKRTLDTIVKSFVGDRKSTEFNKFLIYTKRVWFSNGIHHHYSTKKFIPEFSQEYFKELVLNSDTKGLPLTPNQTIKEFLEEIIPLIFDPTIAAQRVSLDSNADVIKTSSNNYYEGLTQKEVETFYSLIENKNSDKPISYGLNSKLVKENEEIKEKVWKVGGMYSPAIEKIVYWLEKACEISENETQKIALNKLVEFYKTGDLKLFDEYNISWLKDTKCNVDIVNGFIEVYGDPLGYRGAYEGIVSIKDLEATKRIKAISDNAQWFEDNSPIDDQFKKKNCLGISAKVITVVVEAGDASPPTPIGINLPNSNWIRKEYGSKSVNLGNIVYAYDKAASEELLHEFCFNDDEIVRAKKYAPLADNIHTDLHEVIGHGSGQINPRVGTPKQTLKNYASAIEETRADLVALYYLPDKKLLELGLLPNFEAVKAGIEKYIRNGLMLQLYRIEFGDNIEESHMRNRQLISGWAYEKGRSKNISDANLSNKHAEKDVIEKIIRNGKTFFVINDFDKLRIIFGELLKEIQRITSEGDYEAAKYLIETYGVKVDPVLHKEVKERYSRLNIAPYRGFINPVLTPVYKDEKIIDIKIEYPEDFLKQMLYYAEKYSFLQYRN
ncbi:MAG: dipeptidyl-peptidase 3 family protein [Ignavibacteriaceae bacterium]